MGVRHLAHQRNALGHVQLVLGNVVVAERRRRRVRGQLEVARQRPAHRAVLDAPHGGRGGTAAAAAQLRDEHRLQRVHGAADVAVAHLLVEDQAEAVAAFAVLARRRERMELRLDAVLLRAKAKALRQRQHTDAVRVERIPGDVLRIVGERFAFVRPVQRRAVQIVACWVGLKGDGGGDLL